MQNPVAFLLLIMALAGPLAAQPLAPLPPATVPAEFDVAGVHLVLNEEAQRLVQQKADGLRRHQPSFQARVDLADASFPIIDRVLREEGVPLDFRYLALQESALQGNARSNHEAVGYWQLKEETATGLGLAVNNAVDERQHLTASTRAAARYLARSNNALHNWPNALLSYYTGLGGVKPYTLPTDFDATEMAITEATSPYVLMFLAQKIAFEPACGLNPKPALLLREYPAVAGQSLAAQALALHADPTALAAHNHWLLAAAVPPDRAYTLIVPVGNATLAAGPLASQRQPGSRVLLNRPATGTSTAQVRVNKLRALIALPGETTLDLARRAHQRLGEFLKHNELTAFDKAIPGRPYFLESKRDMAAVEYHVLQPGETIFDVAQQYGMRQKAVLAKNRLHRVDEVRPGRVLWLQHTRPREVAVEYRRPADGPALERPVSVAATTQTDVLLDRANEIVAARQQQAPADEKIKIKIKVKKADAETTRPAPTGGEGDGWGEALSTATATAAAAPVPVVRSAPAPRPTPPAPAPTPEPADDEAAEPAPEPELPPAPAPVAVRPATVYVPRPAPAPLPSASPVAKPVVVAPAPKAAATPWASAPAAVTPMAKPRPAALAAPTTHRVAPKESVFSISRLYGIAPATLMALNDLTPPANITVGQVLLLPLAGAPAPIAVPQPVPVAKPVVSAASRANPALYVPNKAAAPIARPVVVAAAGTLHTVVKGETLFSISRQYNVKVADLQAWNGKAEEDKSARIGEVLRVSAGSR